MNSYEQGLKEEIELWKYLIDVSEDFGENASVVRLKDALNLAEHKLQKWRPRKTTIDRYRRSTDISP